jgi:uncharacterized protein (DUF2225 family)
MASVLWNKKLKCPFCNFEFETTRMRSSAMKVKQTYSDFGAVFESECPYLYAVTACPQCLFTARNEHFESVLPQYENKLMEASKKARLPGSSKPPAEVFASGTLTPLLAVQRHALALASLELFNHPDLGEKAGLCMHVVWIWRLIKAEDKEKEAIAVAIKAYEEFFAKGAKLPERLGEPGVLYLIGELHHRLGNLPEARRYLERALASKEIRLHPSIENNTRDMMLTVKTEMEKPGGAK